MLRLCPKAVRMEIPVRFPDLYCLNQLDIETCNRIENKNYLQDAEIIFLSPFRVAVSSQRKPSPEPES